MATVYVSIGSNIDRYRHIAASLDALQHHFGELVISPVYETESIGFVGEHFLNLVVAFQCRHSVAELAQLLRGIEYDNGRQHTDLKFAPRTLDIDILTYDSLVGCIAGVELPRSEITENAFVLRPLVDIAGSTLHPRLQKSYAAIWQAYDQSSQQLWPVDFHWQDRQLSKAEQ